MTTTEAQGTSAEVTDALREAILRGDFVSGQRLIEADLRERFGATRFVIRTALQSLAGEGLVEVQHNRGARVREVTLAEAIEICEVRRSLEGLLAERAADRATQADRTELKGIIRQMKSAAKAGDFRLYNELHAGLHRSVRRIAAHETTTEILDRLRGKMVRLQFQLELLHGRSAVSLPQYQAIVDAIVAADPAAAESAMHEHITSDIDALKQLHTWPVVAPGMHTWG
jgi:DNA-binding GntR family transcriptional regulator